ncbi:sporulation protein YjcZ [Evansella sp. AB-rgal1]
MIQATKGFGGFAFVVVIFVLLIIVGVKHAPIPFLSHIVTSV